MCFHSAKSQSWSCTSWSSIGIDFIDLPFWNFFEISSYMKASFYRGTYCMCQGDAMTHEVVNLGLRMVNSKDLLFWSGISPLRSYSRQHCWSPWKGILGCTAERFWAAKHSSFSRHADQGVGGGLLWNWGVHNVKSPQLSDRMTLRGKALSVILSLQMEPPQQVSEGNTDPLRSNAVIQKLFNSAEVNLLGCLRDA